MKLAETKFTVYVNQNFIQLTGCQLPHLAWFVKEAADNLDVEMWTTNEAHFDKGNNDMDCWLRSILLDGKTQAVFEALPFPAGALMISIQNYPSTVALPSDPKTAKFSYPDDFAPYLNKTSDELNIQKVARVMVDGQNRKLTEKDSHEQTRTNKESKSSVNE